MATLEQATKVKNFLSEKYLGRSISKISVGFDKDPTDYKLFVWTSYQFCEYRIDGVDIEYIHKEVSQNPKIYLSPSQPPGSNDNALITLNRAGLSSLLSCLAQVAGGEKSSSCIIWFNDVVHGGKYTKHLHVVMDNEGDMA